MEELIEIFKGETEEILQNLEHDLVLLEDNSDPEAINRVFRYVHTLKGSSGIAGLHEISEFTHKLENLLDAVRSGDLKVNGGLIDILLESMDLVKALTFGGAEDIDKEAVKKSLLDKISAFRETGSIMVPRESTPVQSAEPAGKTGPAKNNDRKGQGEDDSFRFFRVRAVFREDIFEFGLDPLSIIEDLSLLGRFIEIEIINTRLPAFLKLDPEKCYIGWDIILRTKQPEEAIKDVFLFVLDDNDITIENITGTYKLRDSRTPLETKKIGEIMVEEKIITENELDNVLSIQDIKNKKLAEIMVEKGYATEEDVKYALEEQEKLKKRIETTTVRVATSKLDNLMNLLGEIVIGQSAISRVADELSDEDASKVKNAVYGLDRVTREFQEQIMSIRMIPIGPTFEQFRRFVRDSARDNGKDIRIIIEGGETELDKTVIEKIGDPLKHMIRNSIDHGIEPPEERRIAGKDKKGVVRLKAYHQEGNVFIEISDDGRGIDREKVRKKAEALGYISPGDEVSEERLNSFLFAPGFSTAEKVGALSGRGVGMDVVKTNIEELRGTVEIHTRKGEGTTFRIKLPLTLAIIEGMLVRVGNNTYVIPLLSIVESIQPSREKVKTVEGKGETIFVRGEYISFIRLYELFKIQPDFKNPWESLVVVVESNGVNLGIMVDELIGQQQIVIKSIETKLTKNRAISGASILGNGQVSLILDIHGLAAELAS